MKNSKSPGSNVLQLPGAELPGLGMAATAGLGNRIGGSRNELWLCHAYSHGGAPVMLYVKVGLSERAMFVEALCAQIAHCVGLQCPAPFIVTVNPSHVGRARGKPVLAFGAEDQSEKSMARPVFALDVLLPLLVGQKVADLACVFDEWIANDVRSPSDILISPDSQILLIDHEAAIGELVKPDMAVTNWLAARLIEHASPSERALLLHRLRGRLAALQRTRLGDAPQAAQYSQDGVPIYRTLIQFLTQRLQHMDRLLSERVMPEQRYLLSASAGESQIDAAS
jgi:hypothetical protein